MKIKNKKINNRIRRRIFISLFLIFLCGISFFIGKSYGFDDKDIKHTTVLVQRGDSLWNIANKYCDGNNIYKKIEEIRKLNNMKSSEVFIGDEILVPVS